MKIQLLCDNPNSWIVPYTQSLAQQLIDLGHNCMIWHKHKNVEVGDILCLLSCERIFKALHLNKYNLVVHESYLPKGKGWSPVTWQILEGENQIPITLFEASHSLDAGEIYAQTIIDLDGSELINEIKAKQGKATKQLILDFVKNYPNVQGMPQKGEESFYPRRTAKDSELDIDKSIREQFNLLRVCDNNRYPAYFTFNNNKYILKIEKYEESN
jgi:methionyl-tRNA formyltransferase